MIGSAIDESCFHSNQLPFPPLRLSWPREHLRRNGSLWTDVIRDVNGHQLHNWSGSYSVLPRWHFRHRSEMSLLWDADRRQSQKGIHRSAIAGLVMSDVSPAQSRRQGTLITNSLKCARWRQYDLPDSCSGIMARESRGGGRDAMLVLNENES
jgi:hypothetical protein